MELSWSEIGKNRLKIAITDQNQKNIVDIGSIYALTIK